MTHASLFSGIGGFDLAAEWMGWTNVFNCEWEEFPRQILKHHFPNTIQHGDIKELDATAYAGRVDILTGGFPCQPYSLAGKRKGKEDERHLWPEMLRVIRECAPRYVVGENVRGLVNWSGGLVFEEVCADLEACGYDVQPFILPACGVGAPHRRDRVWIVGHKKKPDGNTESNGNTTIREFSAKKSGDTESSDTVRVRGTMGKVRNAPDTENGGRRGGSCQQREERREGMVSGECQGREMGSEATGRSGKRDATNPDSDRLQGGLSTDEHRQQRSKERDAQERVSVHGRGISFQKFPTQPPICGGDDGLPRELDGITFSKWRRESIKAYGNAIVPQVALQIFKAIQAHEDGKTI